MSSLPHKLTLHSAPLGAIDGPSWHNIARLRQDVFVVEQNCPYPDLDARDAEPTTLHLWATDTEGNTAAALRLLHEDTGQARRIGRVATAPAWRGRGVMGALLVEAIALCGGLPIEIEAQAHLQAWYERFGFVLSGEEFLEDGIPHVPMQLAGTAAPTRQDGAVGSVSPAPHGAPKALGSAMSRMIFVNLPVANLAVSDQFYGGLGFTKIAAFSNDSASAWQIDENIWVMLLQPGFFSTFLRDGDQPNLPSGTQQKLNALSAGSPEEVNEFLAAAATNGGKVYRPGVEEAPGMFGGAVKDPDGHIWEVMWMDQTLFGG